MKIGEMWYSFLRDPGQVTSHIIIVIVVVVVVAVAMVVLHLHVNKNELN
jgi:flagellar basal body-associated protein FliL